MLEVDLTAASASDALADTVDYGLLAGRLAHAVTTTRFDLIEALAGHLAGIALEDPRVHAVDVRVGKPQAPVSCRSTTSRCGCAAAVAGDGGLRGTTAGWLAAVLPALGAPETAFLGLGSNLGDPLDHLQQAVDLLHDDPLTTVLDVSSVYLTTPVGGPEQDDYLNLAVRVATRRLPARPAAPLPGGRGRPPPRPRGALGSPHDRRRPAAVRQPGRAHRRLEVPHPRLTERAFALVPLLEVAPGWSLPAGGARLAAAVGRLAPIDGVTMIGRQIVIPSTP